MEGGPEEQYLLVNIMDLVSAVDANGKISLNEHEFNRKLIAIQKKLTELKLDKNQIRFFLYAEDEKISEDIAIMILRQIYNMTRSDLGQIFDEKTNIPTPMVTSFDELKNYTKKDYIDEKLGNKKFELFLPGVPLQEDSEQEFNDELPIFARALAFIDEKYKKEKVENLEERKKIIIAETIEALGLKEEMEGAVLRMIFLGPRHKAKLPQDKQKVIDILLPVMLASDPYDSPSLEAVMMKLARKLPDNEMAIKVTQDCKKILFDKIKKDFFKENISFADQLSEFASNKKDEFEQKYEERRVSHTPIVSALYNKAKEAGKYFRGQGGKVREEQLARIEKVGNIYCKGTENLEQEISNFKNFYRVLCVVEQQIGDERNIFQSGLKQLCRHYRRELAAMHPELANEVENDMKPKRRFTK